MSEFTRYNKDEIIDPVEISPERVQAALAKANEYVDTDKWEELDEWMKSLPSDDPLLTQTDFLLQIHERLFALDRKLENRRYTKFGEEADAFASLKTIVSRMGKSPNALSYLQRVVNEDRIPPVILREGGIALTNNINQGAEVDKDPRWHYYSAVGEAAAQNGTVEAVQLIGQLLKKINVQVESQHQADYNKWLSNTPEEWKTMGVEASSHSAQAIYEQNLAEAEKGVPAEIIAGMWAGEDAYFAKADLIRYLGETQRPEAVSVIINFLKDEKFKSPEYFSPIITALKKIDQNLAAKELLNLAKGNDETQKRNALWLLYRLEIGQVGVSEEGVRYLQKVYDIGEFNSPNYYVERITSGGEVGIFNRADNSFQKHFKLEGLDSEQKRIQAQLLDITYATLFGPHAKESSEERVERERLLEEFKQKYFEFFHSDFFKALPVKFNDLTFQEQGQFLKLYEGSNDAEKEVLKAFCKKYGLNGFRTFLSLDYADSEQAKRILNIGERLPAETASLIFTRYAAVVDTAWGVEEKLFSRFRSESKKSAGKIYEHLMKKGKDLLAEIAATTDSVGPEKRTRSVYERLNKYEENILLYAAMAKYLPAERVVKVEDFIFTGLEEKDSGSLSQDEKQQMLQIFEVNREASYPDKLYVKTVDDFRRTINEKGHTFRILKENEQVVAFFHYDDLSHDTWYVGSLNSHPSANDSPLAVAMARSAVEENKHKTLRAVVWANNPARLFYSKFLGFKKVGEIADFEGTGETYWEMERPSQAETQIPKAA
jgi:hypothetical protein